MSAAKTHPTADATAAATAKTHPTADAAAAKTPANTVSLLIVDMTTHCESFLIALLRDSL